MAPSERRRVTIEVDTAWCQDPEDIFGDEFFAVGLAQAGPMSAGPKQNIAVEPIHVDKNETGTFGKGRTIFSDYVETDDRIELGIVFADDDSATTSAVDDIAGTIAKGVASSIGGVPGVFAAAVINIAPQIVLDKFNAVFGRDILGTVAKVIYMKDVKEDPDDANPENGELHEGQNGFTWTFSDERRSIVEDPHKDEKLSRAPSPSGAKSNWRYVVSYSITVGRVIGGGATTETGTPPRSTG